MDQNSVIDSVARPAAQLKTADLFIIIIISIKLKIKIVLSIVSSQRNCLNSMLFFTK